MDYYKPHALQVSSKVDLCETLIFFRSEIKYMGTLCHLSNVMIPQSASKDVLQPQRIMIILPELIFHHQLSFPVSQRVTPTSNSDVLYSRSINAYTDSQGTQAPQK